MISLAKLLKKVSDENADDCVSTHLYAQRRQAEPCSIPGGRVYAGVASSNRWTRSWGHSDRREIRHHVGCSLNWFEGQFRSQMVYQSSRLYKCAWHRMRLEAHFHTTTKAEDRTR